MASTSPNDFSTDVMKWHGIGVPKNTPADIVENLNNEINAVLTDPKLIARLAELGGVPMPMTPVQFGQFVAWRRLEQGQRDTPPW